LFICTLILLLTSCSNKKDEEEIVQPEEEAKEEVSIIPSYSLSEDQYKMVLPFRLSQARDMITHQITNIVDIDELEQGLRRHSTEVFDPEKYVFEEGQYLDREFFVGNENEEGIIDRLNPKIKDEDSEKDHRNSPRV